MSILFLLVILVLIAPSLGFLAEDAQTVMFPLCSIAFYFIPKSREQRLPLALIVLISILWIGTSAFVRGALPTSAQTPHVYLSRLSGDGDGLRARAIYQRYNEIARTYELPKMELVQRFFSTEDDARQWLRSSPQSPFVIWGSPEWYGLVFAPSQDPLFLPHRMNSLCSGKSDRTASPASSGEICIPPFEGHFKLVFLPESIGIPDEPPELGRHFIAWLARGLSLQKAEIAPDPGPDAGRLMSESAQLLAMRRDALTEALRIEGPWASGNPHGLAHFLLGTLDCIEWLNQADESSRLLESSLGHLRKAASLVAKSDNPRLFAAIFNNAALVKLLLAEGNEDVLQAKRWLDLAVDSEKEGRGLRYALENLALVN